MKKKKSSSKIISPSKEIKISGGFDYLLSLKDSGKNLYGGDDLENINKSASSLITSMDVDTEINIAKTIRELVSSNIIVPKDMKIDDSDLPMAENFYQWVTQDRFGTIGDERPFLEQLIWGLVAFNDVCYNPKCTDLEWLLHSHKVDDTYAKLERKVSILVCGVCPNCGRGRSKQVMKGKMPFYNELAINAGQRCVIGETPTITAQGLLHMDEIMNNPKPGFTDLAMQVHNGKELEYTSAFFYAEPEPVVRVDTAMGFCVTGTREHPIFIKDAFVKLRDVKVDDPLKIMYGQRVFGTNDFAAAHEYGLNFYNSVVPFQIRTAKETDVISFLQGVFRERRRVFVGMSALRDTSALLLNAGYPHEIHGPSILLSAEVFEALKTDSYSTGAIEDKIASVRLDGMQATYDFTLPDTHQFITGGILSHNSGKSHTVGTYLFPYLVHRLLKTQRPAQFYGLSRTTVLQGTFAALTYTQAKDTLWTPFFGAITQGKWFQNFHSMLKHYENVYGEKLFKLTDTFVDYRVRGLQIFPMGPDMRIMRGRTRFGFSIDEIAYFDNERDSGKVKINAHEVYDALANSLATVRTAADQLISRGYNDVFPAYAFNVSSPTSKADMIHVLLERAKDSRSMYGIHRATWEVNPNFKRNSPFITEAYRKDPESAEKNFAANPPLIANPFIANHKMIQACEGTKKNKVVIKTVFRNSKQPGQSYMYGAVDMIKKSGRASIMAIDAGEKDNSFSIACGSTVDGVNLNVDLIGEVIPLPGYRINHSLMYEHVILPIMKARNVKVLLADRWNSLTLLSDAQLDMADPDEDIPTFIAKQYSLKYVDMVGVRTRMEQGSVLFPRSELPVEKLLEAQDADYRDFYKGKPIAHLFKQLYTIRDLLKGVGKGAGYTDDNWRAAALLLYGLQHEEYLGLLMAEPVNMSISRPSALAASKLASGTGTSVGSSGGKLTTINGAPLMVMSAGRR